jgi:hypothetical protein
MNVTYASRVCVVAHVQYFNLEILSLKYIPDSDIYYGSRQEEA